MEIVPRPNPPGSPKSDAQQSHLVGHQGGEECDGGIHGSGVCTSVLPPGAADWKGSRDYRLIPLLQLTELQIHHQAPFRGWKS